MKIKIGNKIYDGTDKAIMVILTDEDKENIASMPRDAHRYAQAPNGYNEEELLEWMEVPENEL